MQYPTIHKRAADLRVEPNLADYASARASFSWEAARAELSGLPGGGLNIAYECIDRHAAGARRDHIAIRWLGRRGDVRDLTYGDLNELTNRFANALATLGKALFFDADLSVNGTQSCASCHGPEVGFTGPDSFVNAHGAVYLGALEDRFGARKPPTSAYAGYSPVLYFDETANGWIGGMFWDGRATGASWRCCGG